MYPKAWGIQVQGRLLLDLLMDRLSRTSLFQNYFKDPWNAFDFFIVVGSFVDLAMANINVSSTHFPPPHFSLLSLTINQPRLVSSGCSVWRALSNCSTKTKASEPYSGPFSSPSKPFPGLASSSPSSSSSTAWWACRCLVG